MENKIVQSVLSNSENELRYIQQHISDDNVTDKFKELFKSLKQTLEDLQEESNKLVEKELSWEISYSNFYKSEDREDIGDFSLTINNVEYSFDNIVYYPREEDINLDSVEEEIIKSSEKYPALKILTDKDFFLIARQCCFLME